MSYHNEISLCTHKDGYEKKKTENKKCCQGNGNPYTLLMGNVRWYDYYGKIWQFLKKLNVELQYDPITSYPHPNPNPRKRKTDIHTETCTWAFIATVFVVAGKWEQPDVPPMINGQGSSGMYSGILFSCEKERSTDIFIKLNDRHNSPDPMIPLVRNVQNRRIHKDLQQITDCWGPGRKRK